jgi:hypothetical protein
MVAEAAFPALGDILQIKITGDAGICFKACHHGPPLGPVGPDSAVGIQAMGNIVGHLVGDCTDQVFFEIT